MIATTGRVSVRATYTHRVLPHLRGEGDKDIICQQTSANITQITSSEQHLPNCFMGFFPVAFWNVVAWILRRGLARLAPNFDCQFFLISAAGYGLLFLAIYEQIMVPSTNRTASQSIPRSGIRPREVRVQAVIEYWMSLPGKGIAPCCIASISLMVQWDKSPDRSC
jgi:hypothetical protein